MKGATLDAMSSTGTRMITVAEANAQKAASRAEEVFSNSEKAARWLKEPNPALNNQRPIDLTQTDEGFEAVDDVLTRIESGTYS